MRTTSLFQLQTPRSIISSDSSIEEDLELTVSMVVNSNNKRKIKKSSEASKSQSNLPLLTLDQVFQQLSSVTAPSIQAPVQTDILLTPLSSQACKKHGINPEVLRYRTYESFADNNQNCVASNNEEIQHMRHEAYAKRRFEMMKLATEERQRLIRASTEQKRKQHPLSSETLLLADNCYTSNNYKSKTNHNNNELHINNNSTYCSPSFCSSSKSASATISNQGDILLTEQRRLEKIKARQKKELLMILQAEGKMSEIKRKMEERAEREAQAEDERRKARKENAKRAAEELRLRELRRKAAEEAEEETKRIKAKEEYEREQNFLKEKEHQKQLLRQQASIEAQEKQRQRELHKLQMEQKQELERLKMERLAEERRQKEKDLKESMEIKQEQHRAAMAAHKKKVSDSIKAKQEAARQLEEERKVSNDTALLSCLFPDHLVLHDLTALLYV